MLHQRRLIDWILSLALIATSSAAYGQPMETSGPTEQSVRGVQLKNKAPINTQTLKIRLPKLVEATLANGLRVVLIEDHKLPTLYLQLVIVGRGDIADPKDLQGTARATAAQLRAGTKRRTAQELAEQLDSLGGTLNGYTSTLDSYLTISGLSEHAPVLLDIFADVILHPTFPQAELDNFKSRLLSQLQAQRASPTFMAREQFNKAVYGDHPASIVAPADAHIKRITADDLRTFHDRYWRPNGAWLFASGDITLKKLLPLLQTAFKEWQPNDRKPPPVPDVQTPADSRVLVVDRPGSVQTSLLMGALGIRGDDPDRATLSVINQILGASPASRLFMNLREDKGYTYGAYSNVSVGRFPGVVSASAEVRTEVTGDAMREFLYELKRIVNEPVGAVELANAKRALIGRFALALEDPRAYIGYVFEQKIYNFPADYWQRYAERIAAVTAADVQRVAAKYYDPKRFQFVAVGDGAKIRAVMQAYEQSSVPAPGSAL